MINLSETILGLTSHAPTLIERPDLLNRFASEFGWNPSYHLVADRQQNYANIHLVVEHGLENSAILTFLKRPYLDLTNEERRELLTISYNNLVDWHINIESNKITYIFNRFNPLNNVVQQFTFARDQYEQLRSDAFEKIIGLRPNPNIPSLDDSLINTISHWKRILSSELNNSVNNHSLSTLFNSIIFIRAIEDYSIKFKGFEPSQILLKSWQELKDKDDKLTSILKKSLESLNQSQIPGYLIDFEKLNIFNTLSSQTLSFLFSDFYINRQNSVYKYDFSIMSNHALSKIYERYVALLRVEEINQLNLFGGNIPIEELDKSYGAIYTPQYIARFFAKYLKENLPPSKFRDLKVLEPAVGSGIFLRSLLEIQCDPREEDFSESQIEVAFGNIMAIDIDQNASDATKLSLSLFHLILSGKFPPSLKIITADTLNYMQNEGINENYDVIISNPPFISSNFQGEEMRKTIKSYLGEHAYGRSDSFLAFLKLGIEKLKPGGFGLYVIPHSFLIAESAKHVRKFLYEECNIKCLADLSAIPVFSNVGVYVILLIFQKKIDKKHKSTSTTTIVKSRDFPGKALQCAIFRDFKENEFFSVYEVGNSLFEAETWNILPYSENAILEKFNNLPKLSNFLDVRQGFVTGNDDIFVVNIQSIPKGEESIYKCYLPDKYMERYFPPKEVSTYLLFPFNEDQKLSENEMENQFPKTWAYLKRNKKKLSLNNESEWWRPHRTRQPKHILSPKIVSPHLVISPKFSVDLNGDYTVSRSPYMILKEGKSDEPQPNDKDLLLYFTAILNSTPCFWYISNHSHKYSSGYTMLEVKTLKNTRVPDPASVPPHLMQKLLRLVFERMNTKDFSGYKIEREIDNLVAHLYRLTEREKIILGLIDFHGTQN